ncbi:EVE domain-containing protein [Formosa haliotis]|uniref:EVE domain-containing protein n=1 Tax=Formosa haliotis TaxID=1555194 RepID=UPI000824E7ED|nr:EVE domain-containing protein [Formosa haliotis]
MITYTDYEKQVYEWLMQKHEKDSNFTFSLRMKGSKGTELDYFIGTKKSNYFATTFWSIPVAYPGSSSDCIDLIFGMSNNLYSYNFEFTQTNSPHGTQNQSVLNFIKALHKSTISTLGFSYVSPESNKMFTFKTNQRQNQYTSLPDMLLDIEKDLEVIIPEVNKAITAEKLNNQDFKAHRITLQEFTNMQTKLEKRFKKYSNIHKKANYWIFQGNPDIYNITNALKAAHLKSWKVGAHKDKIKIGDQVILWQTGKDAGCYALAEITSDVSVFEEEPFEKQYYTDVSNTKATDRVKLKITKYLADTPILWQDIKDVPTFSNFNAGNQGTNFTATEKEFNALLEWNDTNEDNSFEETRAKLDPVSFNEFISFVRFIITSFNLKPNDPRVVYSVRGYSLNLIIGQKYCANIYASKNKETFGIIATTKLSKNSEEYAGKKPQTYYSYLEELVLDVEDKKSVTDAIEGVLDKTTKSGYTKSNDIDFQNFLFGLETNNKTEIMMQAPTNKILYGPPGTGKTFYLKDQLFEKYTLKEHAVTKEKYFEDVVLSLTWWQVITLALIEIGTAKVNDILENRWVAKKASLSESKNVRATLWGTLQMHTIMDSKSVAYKQRQNPLIFDKNKDKKWQLLLEEVKEQCPEIHDILNDLNNFETSPQKVIKNYDFVTFHQSFAYEDFIEGIKPISPEEGEETTDLGYRIENGVFKNLCIKAKNDPDNRYAIFIDEINRGNVSAIFGELITLIEIDKRKGSKNEMSITLPYSKKEFSVPSNLDIYGTMNTADRSVEALDTALRRRFEFKEMMPNLDIIENEEVEGIKLSEVLKIINKRIELLLDRDHTIGHSYFCNVNSSESLANAFNNKIMPLLQEYFYGDYGKIGLVLGNGFVDIIKNDEVNFASFNYENSNDFKTSTFVLKQVHADTVIDALKELLGITEVILNN